MRPLADEIRPQTLDDVAGQKHLLGEGALLRRLIENGTDANLIFYGPSGTGKTTVANIIAKQANKTLYTLNATTASLQDVKNVIADVDTMLAPNGILLYLDEIQYFNKKQQQSLLEFLENGKITLIASTTENPYFYIYNAILSRCTVFEFKPVEAADMRRAVERALKLAMGEDAKPVEDGVADYIAQAVGGVGEHLGRRVVNVAFQLDDGFGCIGLAGQRRFAIAWHTVRLLSARARFVHPNASTSRAAQGRRHGIGATFAGRKCWRAPTPARSIQTCTSASKHVIFCSFWRLMYMF